jgi:hypothetical protein
MDSAWDKGHTAARPQDELHHDWRDQNNIHVYVDIDRGPGEPSSRNHPNLL